MQKDGPATPSLSERLASRHESEKRLISEHLEEVEAMLLNWRSQLAQSLNAELRDALSDTRNSTQEFQTMIASSNASLKEASSTFKLSIETTARETSTWFANSLRQREENWIERTQGLLKGTRRTTIVGAAILLSGAAVLAGMSWWTREDLALVQRKLREAEATLSQIEARTGGITLLNAVNGRFVVLPEGTDLQTTYRCEEDLPCLRLPGT